MTAIPLAPASSGGQALIDSLAVRDLTVAAGAAAQPVGAPAEAQVAPGAETQPTPAPSAIEAAVQAAVADQGGLASVLADLNAALQSPDLPQPVQAAIQRVLSLQLPLEPAPTAADLRQATAQSGLFLEAQLGSSGASAGDDLKSALLNLGQVLETWTGASAVVLAGTSAPAPAPPYAGGPVRGQPVAAPGLPPDAPAEAVARRLSKQTHAALSRQLLMQAASAAGGSRGRGGATHWLFEIPLATAQGASVAQFEVDRDGAAAQAENQRVWRARFSLDVAPMGPVHVKITLSGGQARVALWAENDQTRARLSEQRNDLTEALFGDGLTSQVEVFPGAPAAAASTAGQFMDKAV